MTQTLLTPITESPSGQYGWALTLPGSLGPIVKVFQNVKGTWGGCGEWYADTLAELGEASRLAIDYGAGWTLDEVDTAALAAYATDMLTPTEGPTAMTETEHTILVAYTVEGPDRAAAVAALASAIDVTWRYADGANVTSWWVAEDDRQDSSDTASAVFVEKGMQSRASRLLHLSHLTGPENVVVR